MALNTSAVSVVRVCGRLWTAAKLINDNEHGIRADEGITEFLERSAQFSDLSCEIPQDVW